MPLPDRPKSISLTPGLQWLTTDDGSRTLWDEQLDETYHSGCGAVAESLTVYLVNSGIHRRLTAGQATQVLEYGFGTGTAFWLTAAVAALNGAPLRYRALELKLLPAELLRSLKLDQCKLTEVNYPDFSPVVSMAQSLLEEFMRWRCTLPAEPLPGMYKWKAVNSIELELVVGNAADYRAESSVQFDAVYFDPFSPATCPELWCPEVFRTAYDSLCKDGTFVTYCVKSAVRKQLAEVGFEVGKVAGPAGGKREVLLAKKRCLDAMK